MEVNFDFHLQSIDQCRFICTAPMSLLHFNTYASCNILLHIANSKMMKISQMQDRNPYYQPGDDYMGDSQMQDRNPYYQPGDDYMGD